MLGNAPKSSWRPFEQNLKDIGDSLGNTQRGLETRWVHFSPDLQLIGNLRKHSRPNAHRASTYLRHFLFISLKRSGFIKLKKIWRHKINLKAISGSSPIFALSNYTTSSQTQTGATVPLTIHPSGHTVRPLLDQTNFA
jgi:hypothetical protein